MVTNHLAAEVCCGNDLLPADIQHTDDQTARLQRRGGRAEKYLNGAFIPFADPQGFKSEIGRAARDDVIRDVGDPGDVVDDACRCTSRCSAGAVAVQNALDILIAVAHPAELHRPGTIRLVV